MTDDIIADWLAVRARGYMTYAAAAEQLGITPKHLERIVTKARAAGDERVPTNLRQANGQSYDQLHHSPIMATSVVVSDRDRYRAVRQVAGNWAQDADDLAELLDALGLDPAEGRVSA